MNALNTRQYIDMMENEYGEGQIQDATPTPEELEEIRRELDPVFTGVLPDEEDRAYDPAYEDYLEHEQERWGA